MWLRSDLDLIEQVVRDMKELYPVTKYAFTTVPTYTSGQIGFVLSSKNKVSARSTTLMWCNTNHTPSFWLLGVCDVVISRIGNPYLVCQQLAGLIHDPYLV